MLHLAQSGMLLEARHYLPALKFVVVVVVLNFSPNSFLLEWVPLVNRQPGKGRQEGVFSVYFL